MERQDHVEDGGTPSNFRNRVPLAESGDPKRMWIIVDTTIGKEETSGNKIPEHPPDFTPIPEKFTRSPSCRRSKHFTGQKEQ